MLLHEVCVSFFDSLLTKQKYIVIVKTGSYCNIFYFQEYNLGRSCAINKALRRLPRVLENFLRT
jgi:hypothetical protein